MSTLFYSAHMITGHDYSEDNRFLALQSLALQSLVYKPHEHDSSFSCLFSYQPSLFPLNLATAGL